MKNYGAASRHFLMDGMAAKAAFLYYSLFVIHYSLMQKGVSVKKTPVKTID